MLPRSVAGVDVVITTAGEIRMAEPVEKTS